MSSSLLSSSLLSSWVPRLVFWHSSQQRHSSEHFNPCERHIHALLEHFDFLQAQERSARTSVGAGSLNIHCSSSSSSSFTIHPLPCWCNWSCIKGLYNCSYIGHTFAVTKKRILCGRKVLWLRRLLSRNELFISGLVCVGAACHPLQLTNKLVDRREERSVKGERISKLGKTFLKLFRFLDDLKCLSFADSIKGRRIVISRESV